MFDEELACWFWSHVERGGPDECWLLDYKSHIINVKVDGVYARRSARKIAWALVNGYSPPDDVICMMTCRQKRCVNPNHMQLMWRGANKLSATAAIWKPPASLIYRKAARLGFRYARTGKNRYKVMKSWMK